MFLKHFSVGLYALRAVALLTASGLLISGSAFGAESFELRNGDRIALIGDTLIEREKDHGLLETRFHLRFPHTQFIVRNLGWSADTPAGASRGAFDFAETNKVFERFKQQIAAIKPTVAVIGYGMASSFDGEAGLSRFKWELNRLVETIIAISGPNVRFIFLSPIQHEKLGSPFPDPAIHNEQLSAYSKVIKEVAESRKAIFVPLFDTMTSDPQAAGKRFTDNGIHLSANGYQCMADLVERALGWEANAWRAGIQKDNRVRDGSYGIAITNLQSSTSEVTFLGRVDHLSNPMLWEGTNLLSGFTSVPRLQFLGMSTGSYNLFINGQVVATATEGGWRQSQPIVRGPHLDRSEELRRAVVAKNELFFHRWRPQNETYLFGFRKHEQGQNAREIPMFDPLIEQAEQKIASLSKPFDLQFQLKPAKAQETKSTATDKKSVAFTNATQSLPQFEVAPGFEISLYAANPLLAKPIQMNFDPKGRLWVASSEVYPQIEPGRPANDKILILEDSDADGRADRSTVFADGLLIPTGVEPGDGGAYVGQSTELLHFVDTDGDGLADQRRVVLSGFGTEDTHHIIHTLRWAHDGELYFNQSIYIHSHLETPHGIVRLNSGGVLRLRPNNHQAGVFLKGFINSWGHHFDEFGQSFVTDGAGHAGINYGVPGAMYETYAQARRILGSVSPGKYPKFCGLEVLHTPHFPDEWQGNLITCDFRAHRVVRFGIEEKGSHYVTKELPDLVRTTNVTFRPIDVKVGPDGALYIADWSNPIIQHGEVDFRDPRRDHINGRIWRVTAKGRPLAPRVDFAKLDSTALFEKLTSTNGYDRQQARRVALERGEAASRELPAWAGKLTTDRARLEALWMFQGFDVLNPPLLTQLLTSSDGRIRAASVRVLAAWQNRMPEALSLLEDRVKDEHPRVRLEALRTLAAIPKARSAEMVLSILDQPMDPFLDYAAWLSINDLADPWVTAVRNGTWAVKGREKQLEFGLKSIEPRLASLVMEKLVTAETLDREGNGGWIELIAQAGTPREVGILWQKIGDSQFSDAATERALNALAEAARLRNVQPQGDLTVVKKWISVPNERISIAAIRLVGRWKLSALAPELIDLAAQKTTSPNSRRTLLAVVSELENKSVIPKLLQLAKDGGDIVLQRQAILAAANLDLRATGPTGVDLLRKSTNEEDALGFWRELLNVKKAGNQTPASMLASLNLFVGGLPDYVARAGVRAAREGGRNEPQLVKVLTEAGKLSEETEGPGAEQLSALVRTAAESGKALQGERIYRKPELGCVSCHGIGGVGGKVGPDLTSIGASAPADYIVESLYYPNRKIKEGYHSVVVQTTDDEELTGLLVRETGEELVLRDSQNKLVSVPKKNVKSKANGASLMPTGLIESLPAQDQKDLVRFLTELGKPGRFDASKGGVARVWKVNLLTSEKAQFGTELLEKGDDAAGGWAQVYSMVNGALAKSDLEQQVGWKTIRGILGVYAATQFQTTKARPVKFECNAPAQVQVWINGKAINRDKGGNFTADLDSGKHVLTIRFPEMQFPDETIIRSGDANFATE